MRRKLRLAGDRDPEFALADLLDGIRDRQRDTSERIYSLGRRLTRIGEAFADDNDKAVLADSLPVSAELACEIARLTLLEDLREIVELADEDDE